MLGLRCLGPPGEAKSISDLVEVFRKAQETTELEARIRALEEIRGDR
jgi:hypothetical protein